ncbi:polysaccharide biosynthesis tyrosine autokinase [Microbacterium rhizosphaerae]|uniref:Polysaccharide biosynthesis tyrosine autokinase n=1 Tax=Microbacterium rhizosphaerae TaxID=1678237 RepID=A0ABZ0SPM0_9MICO|nr:polysaccharide biosynthesis tyrosine autokinase [Microbacterium rhizosphaerae]WPR89763.1 polysaccharide biosynthesis tyrosine autokinase [Microbacterium rhizosphaerae]
MELRDYARGLRRHWLAILMMVLVGVGVAFGWAKLQTPVYEADANGLIKANLTADQQTLTGAGDTLAQSKVASYLDMATWRDVAQYVIRDLKLDTTPDQLVNRVAVSNPQGTAILKIVAQGSSPTGARALAESWIRGMAATIDKFYGNGTAGSAPVNIQPGDSASLPTTPLFPDVRTALLVGGVIGLGFGVAFALMRTASDRRVRAADEVEKKTDVAVVGTIPLLRQVDSEMRLFDPEASRDGPGFAVAEAVRTLRTNLQFMDVDNPPRTIVVTSPLPGDGKSTIACNLALTLAANGAQVTLVDGDLRRSKVAQTMGVVASAGLSDVLAGRAEVADVMQRSPQSPNLHVLAAGGAPPNPSEVLGSARMKALLRDLAQHSTVIIDAPPLIPVTDGAVLTHQADGALLVVSVGKTTYDLVEKALDTLRKARGRALGIVLNKVPLKGVDASPYSYEYRRQYGSSTPPTPAPESPSADAAEPLIRLGQRIAPTQPAQKTPVPAAEAEEEAQPPVDGPPVDADAPVTVPATGSGDAADDAEDASDYDDEAMSAFDDSLRAFDALLNPDASAAAPTSGDPTPRRHRARRG